MVGHHSVCGVEDGLADTVKSITKQASGGPLMRLELNWLESMPPNTHVIAQQKAIANTPANVSRRLASLKCVSSKLNPEEALQAQVVRVDLGRPWEGRGQLSQIHGFGLEQGDDDSRQTGEPGAV